MRLRERGNNTRCVEQRREEMRAWGREGDLGDGGEERRRQWREWVGVRAWAGRRGRVRRVPGRLLAGEVR